MGIVEVNEGGTTVEYTYERIQGEEGLSVRTIIHSVDGFKLHWHNEMELILVLEGSVTIRIGEEVYVLHENDFILVNSGELHSTMRTKEKNVLLAVQIDPEFFNGFFPDFMKMKFDCRSFQDRGGDQDRFNTIRHYMAKIVWKLNKKDLGYQFNIGSHLYFLGEHLLRNFDYKLIEEDKKLQDTDLVRLRRIVDYINKNSYKKFTLKEIAKNEHLNYYYLSHFIKDKIGLSFQEYLNTVRLNKAVKLLMTTDMSIISISNESGFPNINSFNTLFKEIYSLTPTEFRKYGDYQVEGNTRKSKSYLDVDRDGALEKLFTYLDLQPLESDKFLTNKDIETIEVNSKKQGRPLKNHWQNLMTFGRAHEGLRSNWQEQFKEIQEEIGFNYIRFHGIFNDEIMIYNVSDKGKIDYNWTYVDELFDFFIDQGIKPFTEKINMIILL